MISGPYFRLAFVFLLSFDFFSFSWTLTISFSWLYYTLVCSCPKKWLLLILQTSDKTSVDEWETSADEWRRVKMNERPVQTSKDESKTNERWVQATEDEWEASTDEWETSAILSFMNPESPTVYTSRRTCKFEIKSCVEYFVLWFLIYFFLIHNTNARLIEHDNDAIMMRNVTVN